VPISSNTAKFSRHSICRGQRYGKDGKVIGDERFVDEIGRWKWKDVDVTAQQKHYTSTAKYCRSAAEA
jgi:hypothetical protein